MFAVDTNILVYAHFERYPQHTRARSFCEDELLGGNDFCLGWQVVYEYLRIVTHPKVHEKPLTAREALADLEPYLSSIHCHVLTHTPRHQEALSAVLASVPTIAGNLVHDCHYAALLTEHGVRRIYSADADFRKFPGLDVVDPTA